MAKQESRQTTSRQFVRYELLEEAVRDLAAGQHELHQRLEALVGVVAAMRDNMGTAGTAADTAPALAMVPMGPTAAGGWRVWVKRVGRFLLRRTVGVARRIWDAAHPDPPWADRVILRSSETAAARPRLAVVWIAESREEAGETRLVVQALAAQTVTLFDRVAWHPETGEYTHETTAGETTRARATSPSELTRAIGADYLWTLPSPSPDLPATFVETGLLLLSREVLPFICIETHFWVVPELWKGDFAMDFDALEVLAKRQPDQLLGKWLGGDYSLAPVGTPWQQISRIARFAGPYLVAAHEEPRRLDHTLRSSGNQPSRPDPEGRETLLLAIHEPLTGGLEETLAILVDALTPETRLVLVNSAEEDPLSRLRWRRFARLVPHVYCLAGTFATESRQGVLDELVETYEARLITFPDVETFGALPLGFDPAPFDPALFPQDHLLDEGKILVTMVCDLIASKRPEDFLALAHRCTDDPRFTFLLVGEGPLDVSLADLRRCFGLENLHIEAPRRPLAEVLAASDIVCVTAESEPFPRTTVAALALGRPVLAPAIGPLPELLNDGPCGVVVPWPGNLDEFEAALRRLASASERRGLGEKGPAVAAQVPGRKALVETFRQTLGAGES